MGPPAESEYAVDPVGDATMNPSALHSTRGVYICKTKVNGKPGKVEKILVR